MKKSVLLLFLVFLFFLFFVSLPQLGIADTQVLSEKINSNNDSCILVPENPNLADGTNISLYYQWLNKYDPSKQTYFFLVGGPGAGSEYYLKFRNFWMSTKLGQKFNILFFDPRGVARSSEITSSNISLHDMREYTLSNMTNDIESLRVKLLGNQPIGLIGHSTGGHQVFDYAIRFPKNVFNIISIHGGVTGLGFLTQVYYRLSEWVKATNGIEPSKLIQLQEVIQSGSACDQNGDKLSANTWNTINSFALYGTVSQRELLPELLKSLIQGNVDSKKYCSVSLELTPSPLLQVPPNDPLNAMSTINLIINQNVVCSNFITSGAVSALKTPFHDPTFNFIWSKQCQSLLSKNKITENQFDLRKSLSTIRAPILIIGADQDQWIPFEVQKEIWENMSAEQTTKGRIVELKQCGHFSFYECPNQLKSALDGFFD